MLKSMGEAKLRTPIPKPKDHNFDTVSSMSLSPSTDSMCDIWFDRFSRYTALRMYKNAFRCEFFVNISIYISVLLSACMSVCLSISVYLSIYLSVHPSVIQVTDLGHF